nr:hypothetical protein [Gaiella occulta]
MAPAAKAKRRPLTLPSEIRLVRALTSRAAAATGSRGRPSVRTRTFVWPPGTKPTGAGPVTPFSTALKSPSPP